MEKLKELKGIKVKEIDYGIAYCCSDGTKKWIEINRNLKNYPKFYKKVIKHELIHYHSKNDKIDFLHDLKDIFAFGSFEELKFMLKNPKSLFCMSPVLYDKKGFGINYFLLINYSIIGLCLGGALLLR